MALTSETYIDKLEILEDGQMQVREAKVILEDGKEISRAYHRMVLDPGRDTLTDVDTKTTATFSIPVGTMMPRFRRKQRDVPAWTFGLLLKLFGHLKRWLSARRSWKRNARAMGARG